MGLKEVFHNLLLGYMKEEIYSKCELIRASNGLYLNIRFVLDNEFNYSEAIVKKAKREYNLRKNIALRGYKKELEIK